MTHTLSTKSLQWLALAAGNIDLEDLESLVEYASLLAHYAEDFASYHELDDVYEELT